MQLPHQLQPGIGHRPYPRGDVLALLRRLSTKKAEREQPMDDRKPLLDHIVARLETCPWMLTDLLDMIYNPRNNVVGHVIAVKRGLEEVFGITGANLGYLRELFKADVDTKQELKNLKLRCKAIAAHRAQLDVKGDGSEAFNGPATTARDTAQTMAADVTSALRSYKVIDGLEAAFKRCRAHFPFKAYRYIAKRGNTKQWIRRQTPIEYEIDGDAQKEVCGESAWSADDYVIVAETEELAATRYGEWAGRRWAEEKPEVCYDADQLEATLRKLSSRDHITDFCVPDRVMYTYLRGIVAGILQAVAQRILQDELEAGTPEVERLFKASGRYADSLRKIIDETNARWSAHQDPAATPTTPPGPPAPAAQQYDDDSKAQPGQTGRVPSCSPANVKYVADNEHGPQVARPVRSPPPPTPARTQSAEVKELAGGYLTRGPRGVHLCTEEEKESFCAARADEREIGPNGTGPRGGAQCARAASAWNEAGANAPRASVKLGGAAILIGAALVCCGLGTPAVIGGICLMLLSAVAVIRLSNNQSNGASIWRCTGGSCGSGTVPSAGGYV